MRMIGKWSGSADITVAEARIVNCVDAAAGSAESGRRHDAEDTGAAGSRPAYVHQAAQHTHSMAHDFQAHTDDDPSAVESDPVIGYGEPDL